MRVFGRLLCGAVWAAPGAVQMQPGSGLSQLALLFHTSSQQPAAGGFKRLASLNLNPSDSRICLILLDMPASLFVLNHVKFDQIRFRLSCCV